MTRKRGFFVTGTDTEIGKTWSTVTLLRAFQAIGLSSMALKPVSAGCHWREGRWLNDDALLLREHSSFQLNYDQVNPYAFEQAISPHLAAKGVCIDVDLIRESFNRMIGQADVVFVEGAGGWLSPMANDLDNQGLALALELPVILVIGMRLGCINHACLTYQAIRSSGLTCAGWIANSIDPNMQALEGNLAYLRQRIEAPFLGLLPFARDEGFVRLAEAVNPGIMQLFDLDQQAR